MRKHQALLGHFFHAASQPDLLKPMGAIHVSLGGRQATDWRLLEQAARHGLAVALETVRLPHQHSWQRGTHTNAHTPLQRLCTYPALHNDYLAGYLKAHLISIKPFLSGQSPSVWPAASGPTAAAAIAPSHSAVNPLSVCRLSSHSHHMQLAASNFSS